jgi:hypothetical protein
MLEPTSTKSVVSGYCCLLAIYRSLRPCQPYKKQTSCPGRILNSMIFFYVAKEARIHILKEYRKIAHGKGQGKNQWYFYLGPKIFFL